MKSKFVRRLPVVRRPSSVSVAIISVPNALISFKFWLLLPLGYTLGLCLNFEKKIGGIFLRICFIFVNTGPYGSQHLKTLLLLQIAAESFQTSPEFSSK